VKIENINTKRFILRKVEKEDCDEIFEILSDEKVNENLNMDLHTSKQDTLNLIEDYLEEYENGLKFPFAIIEKDTNTLVGVFLIKLDLYDEDCFEFTVYISKEEWGKGIYTEVLPYMTKFAFEKIGTGNFRGFVMEKNIK
jgi:ribosomal-protein-alanine N-acetyltransferase